MPTLTPELLRVFIKRIDVMEKEVKYSRTCGNTILIHYTFEHQISRNIVESAQAMKPKIYTTA